MPTVMVAPLVASPSQSVTLTLQGFKPAEAVYVSFDDPAAMTPPAHPSEVVVDALGTWTGPMQVPSDARPHSFYRSALEEKWSVPFKAPLPFMSDPIVADGHVYLVSYALQDAHKNAQFIVLDAGSGVPVVPAVGIGLTNMAVAPGKGQEESYTPVAADGWVYVNSPEGRIYAFDSTDFSKPQWIYPVQSASASTHA